MATSTPPIEVVILAAGKGTRMYSDQPKVLHEVAGKPLLAHVITTAQSLAPSAIHVVYGYGGEQVRTRLADAPVRWALQAEQKGTGHAVQQALPAVGSGAIILVLYGDVPLTRPETLKTLMNAAGAGRVALLTMALADPTGYGRIVRDAAGDIRSIVEQKDATPEERKIREINTGILAVPADLLRAWAARLGNQNAQGEYYLTDIIAMAVAQGVPVHAVQPEHEWEILGVNSKAQLAFLERIAQRQYADQLMTRGVTLRDPARLDVRGEVEVGRDVEIDVNVVLEGRVVLGDRVKIGAQCCLRDCEIGSGSVVHANSIIEQSRIGAECRIGPFARIRPETVLANHAHIGNFVEIKKSEIGEGSKINHLSYVGDSTVGRKVNIGAGTITCNYDGAHKHRTVIADGVFIGSDTQLVAPVTVGENATVGAGTTVTQDVPPGQLAISRVRQQVIAGWKRPVKPAKK